MPHHPLSRAAHRLLAHSGLLLALGAAAPGAWAQEQGQLQAADLQLSFAQAEGTAGSWEVIPVRLKLHNRSPLHALRIDPALPQLGLGAGLLPPMAWAADGEGGHQQLAFASYGHVQVATQMVCSGSFLNACDPSAYRFEWATENPFAVPLSLAAGQSLEYLWGHFVPDGRAVPAGRYELYTATLAITADGLSADGRYLFAQNLDIATCKGFSAAECAGQSMFGRTVSATVAVPEPPAAGLLALGLLLGTVAHGMLSVRTGRPGQPA